jgi:hypothetical protein
LVNFAWSYYKPAKVGNWIAPFTLISEQTFPFSPVASNQR